MGGVDTTDGGGGETGGEGSETSVTGTVGFTDATDVMALTGLGDSTTVTGLAAGVAVADLSGAAAFTGTDVTGATGAAATPADRPAFDGVSEGFPDDSPRSEGCSTAAAGNFSIFLAVGVPLIVRDSGLLAL